MTRRPINLSFIRRALIVILAATALALTLAALYLPQLLALAAPGFFIGPPLPAATPLPPTVLAPAGPLPDGPGSLIELAQYSGAPLQPVGSGFLLALGEGALVGVTTAHSLAALGEPGHSVERLAFALPGEAAPFVEFDTLHGAPGVPRTRGDLTVDYVLLRVTQPLDSALALQPDRRGGPEVGERIVLYGREGETPRTWMGTILTAEASGAWALMDANFAAHGLSGSPLLSAHTGQVVGMAIAAAWRGDRLLIGLHPIGSLVARAQAAETFPAIAGYTRP